MKIFVSAFMLIASFTIGWSSVQLFADEIALSAGHGMVSQAVAFPSMARENSSGKIYVLYAGSIPASLDNDPSIRFLVYNDSGRTISYKAHFPGDAYPEIKIGGKRVENRFRCGTGIKTFSIGPGSIQEMRVSIFEFSITGSLDGETVVGFYLDRSSNDDEPVYSEPFQLPDDFRNAVTKLRK